MEYPWQTNRRINAYTGYLHRRFGCRIQKLSVNAGFTCPNRDGTLGTGGCVFCDNSTFSPSYTSAQKSITQQLIEGMEFHAIRYKTNRYFAYFQSFSNTYAPLERLKTAFEEALSVENVVGIVVGTRPDCIDDEKLNYLSELAKKYYVLIEYGIETCYDKTLQTLNRGHDFAASKNAVAQTHAKGIYCGAHFMFGFPTETKDEMLDMANCINELPIKTIKFHQLQIIKGTPLAQTFYKHPEKFSHFPDMESYVDFIISFLERLNPNIMIERIAGEMKPEIVLYPQWKRMRYDQVLQVVEKEMERRGSWQGKTVRGAKARMHESADDKKIKAPLAR
ncbi:MAG: TIGR01212 family radical SAM protein [Bacteroidales bacterium]|nr:TIGR01212 family radical SAM protein [Bacteroidales bacterium]